MIVVFMKHYCLFLLLLLLLVLFLLCGGVLFVWVMDGLVDNEVKSPRCLFFISALEGVVSCRHICATVISPEQWRSPSRVEKAESSSLTGESPVGVVGKQCTLHTCCR